MTFVYGWPRMAENLGEKEIKNHFEHIFSFKFEVKTALCVGSSLRYNGLYNLYWKNL